MNKQVLQTLFKECQRRLKRKNHHPYACIEMRHVLQERFPALEYKTGYIVETIMQEIDKINSQYVIGYLKPEVIVADIGEDMYNKDGFEFDKSDLDIVPLHTLADCKIYHGAYQHHREIIVKEHRSQLVQYWIDNFDYNSLPADIFEGQ